MTSRITRDDVEAALWSAGIRSRHVVARLMTLIEVYAASRSSAYAALSDLDALIDPHAHLAPGQWDGEVTRCASCGKPKRQVGNFPQDKTHPSGFKVTCRLCQRQEPGDIPEEVKIRCPGCEVMRTGREFRWEQDGSHAEKCRICENGWKTFKCTTCKKDKKVTEFPPEKLRDTRKRMACLSCSA